ncbi:MAG: radical SAM protein [Deltaproteobacteria bacterium]|nr:radical SAM protein [Deltaproteobacteria bacterium]
MRDQPAYMNTFKTGALSRAAEKAQAMMAECVLCPRECRVNRLEDETGFCDTAAQAKVSSYQPHFGEEDPLVGEGGSGTIFFTHCNLLCQFCQNFEISHGGEGQAVSDETLASMMLKLQEMGCHNINFVTPSHVVPQILSALIKAVEKGLCVPLVYNTGGYDKVETLKLLDGIVDIYMPDLKFVSAEPAAKFMNAPDYPDIVKAAIKEMHRQVGDLTLDDRGMAVKGLLVRHLVMPADLAGTREAMRFLAQDVSTHTYVNIMGQYHPCGRARQFDELARRPTMEEYDQARLAAGDEGITRLDRRERLRIIRWF